MSIDLKNIRTYTDGKASFMVGLFEELNLPHVFDTYLEKESGRPPEIPYGILAEMMLVNLCDDHHPLSRLNEYYKFKDIEGIFHHPLQLSQINDDRFGGFLDLFHQAGPRKIFSEISANAFIRYGLSVRNINFDTTSKVMWGTYEVDGEKEGVIKIDYGYSKQKRQDKKQIKMAIGAADGIIVDAKVMSGNADDKSYNKENLNNVEELLIKLEIDKSTFYYIADSALFSQDNLLKARDKGIKLITRIPDNTKAVKNMVTRAALNFENMKPVEFPGRKGRDRYKIFEEEGSYHSIPLKYCICYSAEMRLKKETSIHKRVAEEALEISQLIKHYEGRMYACLEDANIEISKTLSKKLGKFKYHKVSVQSEGSYKRKPGRPFVNTVETNENNSFKLEIVWGQDSECIESIIREQSLFVICSNDTCISAEDLLREYKTQGLVEKKFQQLKSPQFVNSLYLESPQRVEALAYLLLIAVMVLSVAEHVVRREMAKNKETIIGPGRVKMTKPSLVAIYQIFYEIQTIVYHAGLTTQRDFSHPPNDSIKTVLRCLGIKESSFIRGSTS